MGTVKCNCIKVFFRLVFGRTPFSFAERRQKIQNVKSDLNAVLPKLLSINEKSGWRY